MEHINYLLKEYLSSGDKDEAERCLKELGVPHFHHELVYEVVLLALQDGHEPRVQRLALGLLAFLSNSGDISEDQMLTVRVVWCCALLCCLPVLALSWRVE